MAQRLVADLSSECLAMSRTPLLTKSRQSTRMLCRPALSSCMFYGIFGVRMLLDQRVLNMH